MMLESIWDAVQAVMAGYEAPDGTTYNRARDAFSFELDPRGDAPAFYVEPPQLDDGVQYLGGDGAMLATCTVWLSRPRSDDPDRAALALAMDCGEIRERIDAAGMDWFVQSGASVRVATGDDGQDTTVTDH